MYINKISNQLNPTLLLKKVSEMVQCRLTTVSKRKDTFQDSISEYERALEKRGLKTKLILYKKIKAKREHKNTIQENKESTETKQDKNEKKKSLKKSDMVQFTL